MRQIPTTQVAQLHTFEVIPYPLHGIQLRGIAGQSFQVDSLSTAIGQEGLDRSRPMDRGAIPNDQQSLCHMAPQMLQELPAFFPSQGRLADQGIEATGERDGAHHRQMIAGQDRPQYWSLTTRRIGAYHSRQQIEAAFVDKYQGTPLPTRLFFSSAHTVVRQYAICSSSRWAARSSGFWGVQANCLSNRDTWALWYATPNTRSMSLPIRAQVQTSPRKPYASAPSANSSGKRCNSLLFSRGGAPDRRRARSPAAPYSRTLAIHWLTAPLVTPNAWAIGCCCQPCCLRASACHRRASCQSEGVGSPFAMPPSIMSKKV